MQEKLVGKKITNIILTDRLNSMIKQGMSNLDKRKEEIINTNITRIYPKGKWIFLEFHNDNLLMLGEIIGKFSYFEKTNSLPSKYHVAFQFSDESYLTFQSSLYAFLTIATREEKRMHRYAGNIGPSPNEPDFSQDYFLKVMSQNEKKPIKAALNMQDLISGLGNVYINDILYDSKIHPKSKISSLTSNDLNTIYISIIRIINSAIELGGCSEEFDLYDLTGKYNRIMSKNRPHCSRCGTKIVKENVLGSSSYYCPNCQKIQ
ncbi:MAG: hypothetical protein GYA60_09675 [Candidatus Methanofastidiosa archaeon]|nr:hypothetical protein [Candidatus Methanofastidiosa archaeon]